MQLTGAEGAYGRAQYVTPAWPGQPPRKRCLNGHLLATAGSWAGWLTLYGRYDVTCRICRDLRLPRHTWCPIDPTDQTLTRDKEPPDSTDLLLTCRPPEVRGGIGRIELWIQRDCAGTAQLRVCGPCRVGVLEHVAVDPPHRRLGYGRLLAAAALARGPGYRWTTPPLGLPPDLTSRAFVAAALPSGLVTEREAHRCTDMRRAAGLDP